LTTIENVELPLWATKIGKDQWRERASTALELVGVIGKTKELPKKLSIGEQQKVALARAIAIEPTLILADEPTGKLDRNKTENLLDLMGELNREKGYTFVVATHDASIKSRATKVLELSP
jgi:ABC-type lipoprotein export system ATPase subunit